MKKQRNTPPEQQLEICHRRYVCFYVALFAVLSIATCFLEPHDDDWQYLYYFDNPEAWGFEKYKYVMNSILLPGTYWRPLWSMFNRAEAIWLPMSMPYANHIFISFGMAGIAYMVHLICLRLQVRRKVAVAVSLVLIFATTSMGALLSVDSFQNVYATFFGLMSALCYIGNRGWKRWLLWFIAGWLAAMGKETGFVWFLAGPVFDEVVRQKETCGTFKFTAVNYRMFIPKILVCIIPVVLYLGIYISLKPEMLNNVGTASDDKVRTEQVEKKENGMSIIATMTEMEKHDSYKLTPSTFIKNIGVLYFLGLFPVDTSAIYFKNYALLGITILLAMIWTLLLFVPLRRYLKEHGQEALALILLAVWISAPSMVTRAGEISPIIHMTVVAVAAALLFNDVAWMGKLQIGAVCFLIATVITDIHKYSLAYKAGSIVKDIAERVVADTEGKPERVLMVQVDDFANKKSGAFMINPADGIRKGAAMIREYEYKYPKKLVYVSIPDDKHIDNRVDSLVNAARGSYDCVWFLQDVNSKVYNLK